MRDSNVYLKDILQAIKKIEKYTKGLSLAVFKQDSLIKDAVLRNLSIIGEAANHIPSSTKKSIVDIEWRKIIDLRNILIHEYFGIDDEIIWDVVENKLPELKRAITKHLSR